MRRLFFFAAATAVLASTLFADTASDLRGRLAQLTGNDPVSADVDVQVWSRSSGLGDGVPEQGRTSFHISSSPEGIDFRFPRAELRRAETEEKQNRADPEQKTPTVTALREIDALEAREFLNFAPTLLGYLQRGKVTAERQDTYAGQPARLLTLSVDPPIAQSLRKRLRDVSYIVNVWIGADGIPLGAEASLHGKARFLLMNWEHTQSQRWSFTRRGDHLMVSRHFDQMNGSGFGNKVERKLNVVVSVN